VISPPPPPVFSRPCPKCGADVALLKGMGGDRFDTPPCVHAVRVVFDGARKEGRLVDDEA
jgi:hypothetical protein